MALACARSLRLMACRELAASSWIESENMDVRRLNVHVNDFRKVSLDKLPASPLDTIPTEAFTNATLLARPGVQRKNVNGQTMEAWANYLHVRPSKHHLTSPFARYTFTCIRSALCAPSS